MKVTLRARASAQTTAMTATTAIDDPGDRGDEPEHELEEDERRHDQDRHREQLARCIRGQLSHDRQF